jgi:hypothetical protein
MNRTERFDRWFSALDARHRRHLTTRELARAVRALSARYVERRERLSDGDTLATVGKRSAFALFYAPLHWLAVSEIVRRLSESLRRPDRIVDLGCGTGVAGAAWADAFDTPPPVEGFDRSGWAVSEAMWTYRTAWLEGVARRADVAGVRLPGRGRAVIAAYVVNELPPSAREQILDRLVEPGRRGPAVLIVEPIARGVTPWWTKWRDRFEAAGGWADEWRFNPDLPERLETIGRSAGLDTREIRAKTLVLPGTPS